MDDVSQLRRLGLFDARVPRYTSYPTAAHFTDGVTAGQVRDWMSQLEPGGEISLYIHLPFCRRLCWFCACRTQGTATRKPLVPYLEALKAELAIVAGNLPAGTRTARVHWGGGTPTLMSAAMIAELSAAIEKVLPRASGAEFSVEIDPIEIDAERIAALADAGMTRASIGVQDFDPHIQETIGRSQSYEATKAAVDSLRAVGIDSLNADILFGLPEQTQARISDSVQKLLTMSPDRVALFGYAHVPWMARRQMMIPTDKLPRPEERLALYKTAGELFLWDGYEAIGIDHFARPEDRLAIAARSGHLRRNFQGYTDDRTETLIGIGASAISRYPQGYAQNAASTSHYQAAIRDGRLATARGHAFGGDDLLRGRMIEALMCDFSIHFDEISDRFGMSVETFRTLGQTLDERFPGMLTIDDAEIRILVHGRPLTRMIARQLDAYDLAASGHSMAV